MTILIEQMDRGNRGVNILYLSTAIAQVKRDVLGGIGSRVGESFNLHAACPKPICNRGGVRCERQKQSLVIKHKKIL